jgi:hypothetical protein
VKPNSIQTENAKNAIKSAAQWTLYDRHLFRILFQKHPINVNSFMLKKLNFVSEHKFRSVHIAPLEEQCHNSKNLGEQCHNSKNLEEQCHNSKKPRRTVSQLKKPRRTVSQLEKPRRTVSQLEKPRRTVSQLEKPRRTVSQLKKPRRTVSQLEKPRRTVSQLEKHSFRVMPTGGMPETTSTQWKSVTHPFSKMATRGEKCRSFEVIASPLASDFSSLLKSCIFQVVTVFFHASDI